MLSLALDSLLDSIDESLVGQNEYCRRALGSVTENLAIPVSEIYPMI